MVNRIFVEKKDGYNVGAKKIQSDLSAVLNIHPAQVREIIRYDIEDIEENDLEIAKTTIFSESPLDKIFCSSDFLNDYEYVVIEYLPGQYDQRADSAMQCVQLLTMKKRPIIRCAKIIAMKGVTKKDMDKIKKYLINPVESREGTMELPETLKQTQPYPGKVPMLDGFINKSATEIEEMHTKLGFAMSLDDLLFVQNHFQKEGRNPYETELKVIDTYWSDHCRHTTFSTELKNIKILKGNPKISEALKLYQNLFEELYQDRNDKYPCLMDIATIAVKKLKKDGKLKNLDVSDEINACSVEVDVDVDGKSEKWLIMFKNETHNHPTEIEPFGGAATCLGGAIRDPLSGRTYVYQAMRVTGSGDPRVSYEKTLQGKLPQRVITKTAAAGFSSYGNQIGLATGLVSEMYHENYRAKRLETGYVIAGAPKENVIRKKPKTGDIIILLGGETGRDGCGGATGSSKAHTLNSVEECGAEVQKGNPLTERKLQRLFRNPQASKLIVKCNDFGAGGVSVAIGELSDSLDIDLSRVPKKYAGLTGTELAISESQERMAVVIEKENVETFISLAESENLTATPVAKVTDTGYLRMYLDGDLIVDLSRSFLDTNGCKQTIDVEIDENCNNYMDYTDCGIENEIQQKEYISACLKELSRLNVCSQKGLGEIFDSTIGANTVLMPFGGKRQLTPSTVMASKPPVKGYTQTVTVSSYACYPHLNADSPFLGAIYAIVSSVTKLIISGVKKETIKLTLQEYFMRLNKDAKRWGVPTQALLGALYAQINLKLAAIGGKDSMSGSFEELDVPPTLISFAMGIAEEKNIIHNAFSKNGNVYWLKMPKDAYMVFDFDRLNTIYADFEKAIQKGKIYHTAIIEEGGAISAALKSCMGNEKGICFENVDISFFKPSFGDIIYVSDQPLYESDVEIATINDSGKVEINKKSADIEVFIQAFENGLESVFPSKAKAQGDVFSVSCESNFVKGSFKTAAPRVLIPVFPGTNCEYDTAKAFEVAGAKANILVLKNQNANDIEESVSALVQAIRSSNIIAFPGGFSGGDEPDGSGKFIATSFRNGSVCEAVMELLDKRDGLILGICNGFQALIKLGLVPYGKIVQEQAADAPTLTYNTISRHISTIADIRVATNRSPWLHSLKVGSCYKVPISHGEGRFVSSKEELDKLIKNNQIATQYVDLKGNVVMDSPFNPNGSMMAIEGIISQNGRVFGKMGHSERWHKGLYRNVEGNYDMEIFKNGVEYFK